MLSATQLNRLREAAAVIAQLPISAGLKFLVLCQWAEESGWGAHISGDNNYFGIKAAPGQPRKLCSTPEWLSDQELSHFLSLGDGRSAQLAQPVKQSGARKLYTVQDWFASYPDLASGFAARAKLFSAPVYSTALETFANTGDFAGFVRSIAAHYATSPVYAERILAVASMEQVAAAARAAGFGHA